MRHTFFCWLIALFGFVSASRGAESNDPADHFLTAYTAYQRGEKAEGIRNYRGALAAYKQAVVTLDQVSAKWPSWTPLVVKYRRDRASEAVARVQPLIGKPGDKSADEETAGPLPATTPELPLLPDDLPQADRATSPGNMQGSTRRAPGTASTDPFAEIQNRLKTLQDDLRATREKLERETAEKQELARKYEQAMKATEESARKQVIAEGRAHRAEDALMKAEGDGLKSSDQLKALRAEADAARKAVREIQIDREAGDELRRQFADRLQTATKRIDTLSQERDAARKESADVPKKLGEMQKQLENASKENGVLSTKLAKVEVQLKQVSQERDNALQQIAKMKEAQKHVDDLIATNTTLMAKLEDAQKTITRLNREGLKREDDIAALKKDVSSANKQLAEAKKQSANYQQEMTDLQTQLETQAKTLAEAKGNTTTTSAERKKLQQENDVLRGIVVRQQKEQAIREGKRKLVLTELGKLELDSKALVNQIEYLTSPVVKLTPKERKLFKQPLIEISDAEVSLSTAKESSNETADASADTAVAETKLATSEPTALKGSEEPAANATAPVEKTAPDDKKPEVADAEPASDKTPSLEVVPKTEKMLPIAEAAAADDIRPSADGKPLTDETVPSIDAEPSSPAKPLSLELASAKTPGVFPSSSSSTSNSAETDLPEKSAEQKIDEAGPASPGVTTSNTPNVPADLLGLAREGKDHFERGNYREAEKTYEKILTKAPNNLYALSNLGVVRFRSGKLKLAEESFKKAIAVAPEDAFSHCTLGIVYYSQGKYDEAVNELTKAVAINPKNATAHNYLGITASQKGWQEAAQTELEAATALDPNYADAFFNLAVVFATQQPPNKENARKHYKRATELGADRDSALEQLIK